MRLEPHSPDSVGWLRLALDRATGGLWGWRSIPKPHRSRSPGWIAFAAHFNANETSWAAVTVRAAALLS